MRNFFKKIDETVREMWLGTFLWGCLCELVSVWWVKDRLYSGLGILIGMLLAMAPVIFASLLARRFTPPRCPDKIGMHQYAFSSITTTAGSLCFSRT